MSQAWARPELAKRDCQPAANNCKRARGVGRRKARTLMGKTAISSRVCAEMSGEMRRHTMDHQEGALMRKARCRRPGKWRLSRAPTLLQRGGRGRRQAAALSVDGHAAPAHAASQRRMRHEPMEGHTLAKCQPT